MNNSSAVRVRQLRKEENMGTLEIGNVKLKNPLILGPMAGVTDRPFRRICKEQGAALVSDEMVSANAVKFGNKKTMELAAMGENERPSSLQLFGPDPETIAYAAEKLLAIPFDFLDINMGCPMPKIVNNGEGSALMRDPERAEAIVRACVRVSDRPVTVKMRAGFNERERNAVELAKRCEAAGAAAVAVHGRTREQYYSGEADWEIIRRVKESVSIPVIGNGDVTSREKAQQMMEETGCDFVMIARGARGNPWIFGSGVKPEIPEVRDLMLRHAKMEMEEYGNYLAICRMRKHIGWYTAGFPNSAAVRLKINNAVSYEELEEILGAWAESAMNREK